MATEPLEGGGQAGGEAGGQTGGQTGGLRDRWRAWSEGLLRSPGFQRWAVRFPLTRPIARRRAYRLFDLVSGFVYSQVLLACVELRLLERLAEQPQAPESLARQLELDLEATRRLLAAAGALRLVTPRSGGRYGLGDLGAALLGNPGVLAMIRHHPLLYEDLRDPVALLRGRGGETRLARFWPYAGTARPGELTDDRIADYSALMAASQSFTAAEILDAYPLDRHRALLDLGGGEGAFVAAAAERVPQLGFTLFDLPAVAERARRSLSARGLGERVRVVGGDFFADPLPPGADIVSLVRILHDHDDARALALLKAARLVLPPDGTLLVAEPMAGMPGAEPVGAAYFGFYLLAMGSGRPRSHDELRALIADAGFRRIRVVPNRGRLFCGLIVARP